MSVKIKVYNLPQSGWDLIPLPDFLPAFNEDTNTNSPSAGNNNTNRPEPNTYEITITVQLPALPSFRGLVNNILSTFGVPSHDTPAIDPILSENDNNNNDNASIDKHIISDNDNSNDNNEYTNSVVDDDNNGSNNANNKSNTVVVNDDKLVQPPLQPVEPAFVTECREFIAAGLIELCEEGVGGTYFIKDLAGSIVGVFKPNDEEPGAPANPKDLVQQPLLPPGGGYLREIAAYLLDSNRFAGVPETFLLTNVSNEKFSTGGAKTGSLQRYVKNNGASTDLGSNIFDIDTVHRIGLLDLRIFNLDRNGENLLVHPTDLSNNNGGGKACKGLVPIDHSFSLPPITSLDSAYFEWHFWSQAKKPFSASTIEYIRSIDIEKDAKVLRALGIPESSIMTMIAMSFLLKEAVGEEGSEDKESDGGCSSSSCKWTLFDFANFVARLPPTKPSKLEELVASCRKEVAASNGGGGGEEEAVDAAEFLLVLREKLRDIFSVR